MNENKFNVEDFINQKKEMEVTDNVSYKNVMILQKLAKSSLASALIEALTFKISPYDTRMLDFCSYSNGLATILQMCNNSDQNIETDDVIQVGVKLFLDQIQQAKYRYSFVDTLNEQILDDKKVYPIVKNGDIEFVKIILTIYPQLLANQRSHKLFQEQKVDEKEVNTCNPEVVARNKEVQEIKELFDNALTDMEQ